MTSRLTLALALALGLALTHAAEARDLSVGEQAYVRGVGILLELEPLRTKSLATRSGARGVRARYSGLDLARIAFPDEEAAERFAQARAREAGYAHQQVQRRGSEVIVLRGSRLAQPEFAQKALAAAWGAGMSEEVEAEGAERRAQGEGAIPPLRRLGRRPTEIVPLERDEDRPADEGRPGETPGGRILRPAPEREPRQAPTGPLDLSGAWITSQGARLVFSLLSRDPGGDSYALELHGFDRPTPPLKAVLRGDTLVLSDFDAPRAVVLRLGKGPAGQAAFSRVSGDASLLPAQASAFWRVVTR